MIDEAWQKKYSNKATTREPETFILNLLRGITNRWLYYGGREPGRGEALEISMMILKIPGVIKDRIVSHVPHG